jgi:sec-independent protein translocase protein TatC
MVDDRSLPFTEHLGELRQRLIISVAALVLSLIPGWFASKPLQDFLQAPLARVLPKGSQIVNLTLTEAFGNRMRIALIAGLVFSLPIIVYQIWRFVAPGLYANERRAIGAFSVALSLLFFAGAAFGYEFIFPATVTFFTTFSRGEIPALISQASYQSFAIWMFIAFGAVFETPLAIILLARFGIVDARTLSRQRKYAILLAFVVAAIVTPSVDAFTQTMLALPMYLLYEVGVIGARIVGKRRAAEEAEAPQAEAT